MKPQQMKTHSGICLRLLNKLLAITRPEIIACLLMFSLSYAGAQDRRNKLDALHTSYITEKLNLSDAEAKKFWPVYDDYRQDKDNLKKQKQDENDKVKNAGGFDKMSDKDVQQWIVNETDIQSRQLDLEKQYLAKFEQVLPLRKVAKFYNAEDEFKIFLLKQLMNRRDGQQRRQPQFVPE